MPTFEGQKLGQPKVYECAHLMRGVQRRVRLQAADFRAKLEQGIALAGPDGRERVAVHAAVAGRARLGGW